VIGTRLLWIVVIAAFVGLVSITDFQFRDPDSKLYSALAQDLAPLPVADWIAPQMNGHWNEQGPFRAHPHLALWVTASLIRVGAPAQQSAAIANFLYFLLIFFFVHRIGSLKDRDLGWVLVWATLYIPTTLQYLIRGNLEPPLTAAILGGMYAFLRSGDSWPARIGFTVALLAAVFTKGLQGATLAVFAAIYWMVWSRDRHRLGTLVAAIVIVAGGVALHEWTYRTATGMDFWPTYLSTQTGYSVGSVQPIEKLENLAWYSARVIFFAAPWSLALLAWRRPRRSDPSSDRRTLVWLLICAASLIAVMALFDRRADRYVFPAYPLVAMAGGWLIWESSARVRSMVDRWRDRMPYLFAAALLLSAVGKVVAATHFYTRIQFWR
jgi:hypothetical protein